MAIAGASLLLASMPATVQAASVDLSRLPEWARARVEPPRWAFVVGIGSYARAAPLSTPANDRRLMRRTLADLGFRVWELKPEEENLTRQGFLDAFKAFTAQVSPGDVVMVYFSGHGVERGSANYLVPSDGRPPDAENPADFVFVPLSHILERLEKAQAGLGVVILDACRNDPFVDDAADFDTFIDPIDESIEVASRPAARLGSTIPVSLVSESPPSPTPPAPPRPVGLAPVDSSQLIVSYAAASGKSAYSLFRGDTPDLGSIFTRNLVQHIGGPGRVVYSDLSTVQREVDHRTGQKQKPWLSSYGAPDYALRADDHYLEKEAVTWQDAVETLSARQPINDLQFYLRHNRVSGYAANARSRLAVLSAETTANANATAAVAAAALAAARPIVRGRVETPSAASSGESDRVVVVGRSANVFGTRRLLPFRVPFLSDRIAGVAVGGEVRLLSQIGDTAKVELSDGTIGFIDGVKTASALPGPPVLVDFSTAPDDAALLSTLAALSLTPITDPRAIVQVEVAPAHQDQPGLAQQEAYARSVRLKRLLMSRGASADAVKLLVGSPDLAVDSARITVFR
jgi:hypothetical protein